MDLISYPDAEALALSVAQIIAEDLEDALIGDGWASLAVPGGSTPGPIFDALSAVDLPWDRVRVLLTDERWVPLESPRSNTALLRDRLLVGRAAAATLVPLYAPAPSPQEALPALRDTLAPALPLSVAVLGMGADMHTASLFPGAEGTQLALEGDASLYPVTPEGGLEPRVTLSAKVLRRAMRRHIVITGAEKRAALERATTLPPEEAPVAAVLPGAYVHWAKGETDV